MQNIYKHILVAVLAVLTLAACENEEVEPMTVSDYPTFSATIEGSASRAYDSSWESGDKIGIGLSGSETFENISYKTVNGDGNFTAEVPAKQFIFQDDNPVSFIAYYPHSTPSTSSTTKGKITYYTGTVKSSTYYQTESDQKNYDFLCAEAEGSKSAPDVNFEFKHAMSKISFVFINGDEIDVSNITKYETSKSFIVRGVFDPKTGKSEKYPSNVSTYKVAANLANVKSGEEVTPLILIPQTLTSNTVTLTITVANAKSGTITGDLVFQDGEIKAGNNYRFVIRVSETRLSMEKAIILPWKEEDLGEKEAS